MTIFQIIGYAMLVALLVAMFVMAAKVSGIVEVILTFAIASGAVAWILLAAYLIHGQL